MLGSLPRGARASQQPAEAEPRMTQAYSRQRKLPPLRQTRRTAQSEGIACATGLHIFARITRWPDTRLRIFGFPGDSHGNPLAIRFDLCGKGQKSPDREVEPHLPPSQQPSVFRRLQLESEAIPRPPCALVMLDTSVPAKLDSPPSAPRGFKGWVRGG